MQFRKISHYKKKFRGTKQATRKFPAKVLQHNNLGAVVTDTGRRGTRRFWFRIGRIRPSFGKFDVEITKGFYAEDVLSLPGLAMQIARYLGKQAIVQALEPDDKHFRRELREDLMKFVKSFQVAKWNGTFPKHLTFMARRHCRCFYNPDEKGIQITIPSLAEVEQDLQRRTKLARIDKALGFPEGD